MRARGNMSICSQTRDRTGQELLLEGGQPPTNVYGQLQNGFEWNELRTWCFVNEVLSLIIRELLVSLTIANADRGRTVPLS